MNQIELLGEKVKCIYGYILDNSVTNKITTHASI